VRLDRTAIQAHTRAVQFRGKARLLDLVGLGPSNKALVPEGVHHVDCIDGIRIESKRPNDVMFRELYVNGLYQDDVLAALAALLRPGDVFWDIGANYGFMSIYVQRRFGGRVKCVAFEPNPIVLEELERNLAINGCEDVTVEPSCLSDRIGEVAFYISEDHSWNATMVTEFAALHDQNVAIRVRTTTLDEYARQAPHPAVIKLDVEGAEHLVVSGGRELLGRAKIAIVAEYNVESIAAAHLSGDDYLRLFRELGYRIFLLRRPWWGRYRWESRSEVGSAGALPALCNLVLLK
jgi:FkbM family methyltransferase